MASTNEEEVVAMEESETGRRSTRSRRSGVAPAAPSSAPTRSSRRNKKQETTVEDLAEEEPSKLDIETIVLDSDEPDTKQVMEQLQDLIVPVQDNQTKEADESSSINLFEEFQADTNTQQDEKSSSDKEEAVAIPEECEFIANLAAEEENANSLPSVVDENSTSRNAAPEAQLDEDYVPLASQQHSLDVNGDNTEDATGSSDIALAENVLNGLNEDDSKNTDLDAEMVSEDELPQPLQQQVHDAEEVSDDELPGPKLAELPADAEVVSEDELPHSTEKIAPELPTDTDNVSDEELPAAKQAELPNDTDNVSDEELPAPKVELPKDTDNVSDEELPAAKVDLPADTDNVSDEELPVAQKADLPEDTDNVSDEELPTAKAELPADTDNVSDEELPAAKKAELPADTDNVSDEELESSKKVEESATTETPKEVKEVSAEPDLQPEKTKSSESEKKESSKRKLEKEADTPAEKTGEAPEKKTKVDPPAEPEKKKLPDLDKYWKAVNDDSTDFTAWTYLLQYVDQESDLEAAREAYDAFLAHYPYCYGYWRKYADYEKRKGSKRKCEEVFERGLKAIPLSVDLWIHYLSHVKSSNVEDEALIRSQFERALAACGLEFRSDKLWEAYIKWENEGKRIEKVVALYDRLLATPTQGYANHFDHFKEVVNNNGPVHTLISKDEFLELRAYVRESSRKRKEDREKKEKDRKDKHDDHKSSSKSSKSDKSSDKQRDKSQEPQESGKESKDAKEAEAKIKEEPMDTDDVKAKEDEKENAKPAEQDKTDEKMDVDAEQEKEADDHVNSPEEADAIKDKIISRRKKIHKATVAAVTARWTYEEGIKRPYFHVKPLERCQLKNWKEYLDFEIEQGDEKRVLVLFERCLIACALYDDFWLKLIRYLDGRAEHQPEMIPRIRDGYERACTIHHPDKPSLHLMWSAFEEAQGNTTKAAEILANLEKVCPNLMQIAYRRINLERRRGDHEKCIQLYQTYMAQAKSKTIAGNVAIKYARFLNKIKKNLDQAHTVLKTYLEKDPSNTRVALQLIDLALQRETVDEKEVVEIMDTFMARDGIEPDQKVLFAQRKVEFLEDFGSTAKGLQEAQKALQVIMAKANEVKKKREQSPPKKSSKESSTGATAGASTGSYAAGSYSYANPSSYYGTTASNYQYGDSSSYGYSTWNQQYSQPGYGSYGQWSGYGSYY